VSVDAECIEKVKAGETRAFGPLVERYQGLVFTFLRRQGHDSERARDLLQETFLKALSNLSSLREAGAFKAWLMRIARNESLRILKKNKESLTDFSAQESEALLSRAAEVLGQVDPAARVEQTFDARRLVDQLDRLPTIYRETLLLRFQGGLSYKDVARALDVSLETVKFRIHHGLKLLRALLIA
jgi:RNA polymerase sigma-70 factor (ECF subfamily)